MEIPLVISRLSFLWTKPLALWFSVWAIRYTAGCDYKLSPTARAVRWLVVVVGYVLAVSLSGPGFVRLIPGLTAQCFFCWPNLAYHFTNFFGDWPKTEGRVTSFTQCDSHLVISYTFEFDGSIYGGTTAIKSDGGAKRYSEGQAITAAYDPFNLDESNVSL